MNNYGKYVSPEIYVREIQVESGFCGSNDTKTYSGSSHEGVVYEDW